MRGVHKHFMRFAYRSIGNHLVFYCEDERCCDEGSVEFRPADFFKRAER